MQYEIKLVGFIDILGFREYIARTATDSKLLGNAYRTLLFLNDVHNKNFSPNSRNVSQFSDTIIISYVPSKISMNWLLEDIYELNKIIIDAGLLIRGVIVVGKIIHHQNALLGPALIEAYDIERLRAKYPRIIVDKNALEYLPTNNKYEMELDDDGEFYYNYIKEFIKVDNKSLSLEIDAKFHNIIQNGLKSRDAIVLEKYRWLNDKYQKQVNKTFELQAQKINAFTSTQLDNIFYKKGITYI